MASAKEWREKLPRRLLMKMTRRRTRETIADRAAQSSL
jgi:hypothetical protein